MNERDRLVERLRLNERERLKDRERLARVCRKVAGACAHSRTSRTGVGGLQRALPTHHSLFQHHLRDLPHLFLDFVANLFSQKKPHNFLYYDWEFSENHATWATIWRTNMNLK